MSDFLPFIQDCSIRIFSSDRYVIPLPPGHPFPMVKYALLRQEVIRRGLVAAEQILEPHPATLAELLRVHKDSYVERVLLGQLDASEIRRLGLPWSPELVERSRRSVGGTIEAAWAAQEDGVAVNLAGGTHHAFPDFGAGYCVFNDVAVAIRSLQAEGRIRRALVIDCDVHQGDGTAAIFREDPDVFTLSIHGAKNFPMRKQAGDLDLALPDGTGDIEYLQALELALNLVDNSAGGEYDVAFYLAGADCYQGDRLGRMAMSPEGLEERDRHVLDWCEHRDLPVAIVMAGGYARRIEDTVAIQVSTVRLAAELARRMEKKRGSLR